MRIGIGLPNAVPGRAPRELKRWAEEAESLGFHSLGSIDRLVYDIVDPLVSLGIAAAVTERAELLTSVLNVGWRGNMILFAKQLATIDLVSEGRLTAGLGIGGWPDDFALSGMPTTGQGKLFDDALTEMNRVWVGEVTGVSGPTPSPGPRRPGLLIGGLARRSYARAARWADGWVAPLLSLDLLRAGIDGMATEWTRAGRHGRPRVVTGRYFCCGPDAVRQTDEYVAHYYGSTDSPYYEPVRADCLDSDERLSKELTALSEAGVDDLVLYPSSSSPEQAHLLAEALERVGARRDPTFRFSTDLSDSEAQGHVDT